MKQKFPYYIRLSIILIILISPILAFQIGWYFFGQQAGINCGMVVGAISVTIAAYLLYRQDWRDFDDD